MKLKEPFHSFWKSNRSYPTIERAKKTFANEKDLNEYEQLKKAIQQEAMKTW